MRGTLSILILSAAPVAVLGQGTVHYGQTQPDRVRPIGTAEIRGRVTAADTGRPVRAARVEISAPELRNPRNVLTDLDGRYEIAGLGTGRYTVTVFKVGFLDHSHGQTRPFEPGRPILLQAKEARDEVNFGLLRGGVIAGAVHDPTGEPIYGATVTVWRSSYSKGRRRLVSVESDVTNDLGEFRVFDLPPGPFFVSAQKRLSVPPSGARDVHLRYAPVFFPGTTNVAEAQRTTVKLGETVGGLRLTLAPIKVASVSGRVVDSADRPLLSVVIVSQLGIDMPSNDAAIMDAKGNFTVQGLAPGEYELSASGRSSDALEMAITRVRVDGQNLTGVLLKGALMPRAIGRLVLDPAVASTFPAAAAKIETAALNPGEQGNYGEPVTLTGDLTFAVHVPPVQIVVNPSLPKGWAVRAIRLNGADVTDRGIDFRAGSDVSGIEVDVTNRLSSVSGTVIGAQGQGIRDYTVLLFATEPGRRTGNPRYFAVTRPDQDGRFAVDSLAPGDYYAAAVEYVDAGNAEDPDLLHRLEQDATPFTLREGQSRALTVRLAP